MLIQRQASACYTLHYRDTRQRVWEFRGAPGAPTILMVHGFRGTHHGLDLLVNALPGYRILVPDLPGYGEAEPFALTDLDAYVHYVRWCANYFSLGPQDVLLGHSFGSIIAAHAIADKAMPLGALVLVNPISEPALRSSNALAAGAAQAYYWLAARLPRPLGMSLLRNPLLVRVMSMAMAKTRDRAKRAYIHQQHAQYFSDFADRQVALEGFRASISHDVREVAEYIHVPTLLIAGEWDDLGSQATQEELRSAIPRAQLSTITGTGHLIHYEMPRVAASLITAFLTDLVEHPSPDSAVWSQKKS